MEFTFLVQVQLRADFEVQCIPSSILPGFELMSSRSWQYISCHWDICFNHSAISDFNKKKYCHIILRGLKWLQMHGLSDWLMHSQLIVLVQVRFRTEVLRTQSSTWQGFELMASRSWQVISCHWDACSNHFAISDFYSQDCTIIWLICQHTQQGVISTMTHAQLVATYIHSFYCVFLLQGDLCSWLVWFKLC